MKKNIFIISIIISTLNAMQAQSWEPLGSPIGLLGNIPISHIHCDASGYVYANGVVNSFGYCNVNRFNGNTWSPLGNSWFNGGIFSICSDNFGNIYAAGGFRNDSGNNYVAKYNGSSWSELGGENSLASIAILGNVLYSTEIASICADPFGNVYAAGNFKNSSGNRFVAKFDGSTWSELGGLDGLAANGYIANIHSDSAGYIYASGHFLNSFGNGYVAKYDGTTWSEVGGLNSLSESTYLLNNGPITSACSDPVGNLYAAGYYLLNDSLNLHITKFDGNSWSELGGFNSLASIGNFNLYDSELCGSGWCIVYSLCSDPVGNIYASGNFTNSSGNRFVAKFDGNVWSELGGLNNLAANNGIATLSSDLSGNIYAGGDFTYTAGNYYLAVYNSEVSITEDYTTDKNISLYPNPGNGNFTVKSTNSPIEKIEIYNTIGQIVYTQSINASVITINSTLDAGSYMVKIITPDKSYNSKIFIE
jgi:hypothetical protein